MNTTTTVRTFAFANLLMLAVPYAYSEAIDETTNCNRPVFAQVAGATVAEFRADSEISAYRVLIDGEVKDEGISYMPGARVMFILVDEHVLNQGSIRLKFGEKGSGGVGLHAPFAGVMNQCSHSQTDIGEQTMKTLNGWTSIYTYKVIDPCNDSVSTLELQIK